MSIYYSRGIRIQARKYDVKMLRLAANATTHSSRLLVDIYVADGDKQGEALLVHHSVSFRLLTSSHPKLDLNRSSIRNTSHESIYLSRLWQRKENSVSI